jgi:hypothetical protein
MPMSDVQPTLVCALRVVTIGLGAFVPRLSAVRNRGEANVDPMKHNYYKKLMKLLADGTLPLTTGLNDVDVYHDDWCRVNCGGYCNCDPDIEARPWSRSGADSRPTGTEGVRVAGTVSEAVQPLEPPPASCPHCGSKEFVIWLGADDPSRQAISCDGCGAVMSSTHPLDPEDRPRRRA